MKKDVADIWVKALRSGKYEQTTGRLKTTGGYCCLGVLCDISDNLEKDWGGLVILPHSVQEWAGIKHSNGFYGNETKHLCLATHNDNGKSFNDIADIIEKEFEKL